MLISHSHKYIFVHNYKVAGTSVHSALKASASTGPSLLKKISKNYPKIYTYDFPAHSKASELKERLPKEMFDTYFKFGFVRNPWDWQVSLYKYMLLTKDHHQHQLVKSMNGFEEYIDWRINEDFHLQKEFFYDKDGTLLMDFIGKFENLSADFNTVCEKIGVRASLPHLKRSNEKDNLVKYYSEKTVNVAYKAFNRVSQKVKVQATLPPLNQTKKANGYLKYYNEDTIEKVYQAFKEDIDTFGYQKPVLEKAPTKVV